MLSPTSAELRVAVRSGQLSAWFQPQVDIATGRVVAIEALCRWHHPEYGLLLPELFIPLAERTGLIVEIGQLMVEQSGERARRLRSHGITVDLAVNVSPAQLVGRHALEELERTLCSLGLPRRSVTIEITESLPIDNVFEVTKWLERLRRRGIGISIDDFGVGHATQARVDRLPATELKLDRSAVQDSSAASFDRMVDVVVSAKRRGLRVVAEGVEQPEHLERVRRLGCDRAQGYFIAKPMCWENLLTAFGVRD